jgi:hypothetical protein
MRMMSRAGLHFGNAQHHAVQLTRLPSALESSMHWAVFVETNTAFYRLLYTVVIATLNGLGS